MARVMDLPTSKSLRPAPSTTGTLIVNLVHSVDCVKRVLYWYIRYTNLLCFLLNFYPHVPNDCVPCTVQYTWKRCLILGPSLPSLPQTSIARSFVTMAGWAHPSSCNIHKWVQRGSDGSASGCCKAAPSSNLGSASQWRHSTERTAMRKIEQSSANETDESIECMCV